MMVVVVEKKSKIRCIIIKTLFYGNQIKEDFRFDDDQPMAMYVKIKNKIMYRSDEVLNIIDWRNIRRVGRINDVFIGV